MNKFMDKFLIFIGGVWLGAFGLYGIQMMTGVF